MCTERERDSARESSSFPSRVLSFVLWHARNGYYTIVIRRTHTHPTEKYVQMRIANWLPSGEDEFALAYLQID